MNIERGDILLADFEPVKGSEIGKVRPCLVIQNNINNKFSSVTIVAAITSQLSEKQYPTTVLIAPDESGLDKTSEVLCNQIKTLSVKHRVLKKLGRLGKEKMLEVDEALKASLALD